LLNFLAKGEPLAKTPYREDTYWLDPKRINDFDYTSGTKDSPPNCPFAAHIRKTAPRNLDPLIQKEYLDASVIVRAGVPYGDEVSPSLFPSQDRYELAGHRLQKRSGISGISSPRRRKMKLRAFAGFSSSATNRRSRMVSSARLDLPVTTFSLLQTSPLRSTVR